MGEGAGRESSRCSFSSLSKFPHRLKAEKKDLLKKYQKLSFAVRCNLCPEMAWRHKISLFLCLLLVICEAGRQMSKLSNKKLCADSECSHPILIARATQDYYPADCRFIPIRQGQLVYVYSMLKDKGNLFWAGSVQGSYYGEQEARIGHFPSSVVEELQPLMPANTEVTTTKWDFYCD